MRPLLRPGRINIVMDGQFGSTGKGVISGYIAKNCGKPIDIAMTNAAPNAGHTVDFADGRGKLITNHLPTSALWDNQTKIYLCAGSIIDPVLFNEELEKFGVDPKRVCIHPNAAIVEDEDRDAEKKTTSSVTKIASTQKGVGHALSRKIMRKGNVAGLMPGIFTEGVTIGIWDVNANLHRDPEQIVLMEVPQGFGLGINSGLAYPYTTCRDITVAQALADAGAHPGFLGNVMLSLRTFPIRVGNIIDEKTKKEIGYSGPFYPDSEEKTWEEMGFTPELTTVTKRVRRIATFSQMQYKEACRVNRPSHVFLNFCNYIKDAATLEKLIFDMGLEFPVTHLGVGPTVNDVREVGGKSAAEAAGIAFNM